MKGETWLLSTWQRRVSSGHNKTVQKTFVTFGALLTGHLPASFLQVRAFGPASEWMAPVGLERVTSMLLVRRPTCSKQHPCFGKPLPSLGTPVCPPTPWVRLLAC